MWRFVATLDTQGYLFIRDRTAKGDQFMFICHQMLHTHTSGIYKKKYGGYRLLNDYQTRCIVK